ncbi:hypothetical protein QJS04_geneDACA011908 [Acorus gramineus]|uniref:HEAT repeat-containing protein 5B n=1 Tax=Acorus gramineus TaxID=55184 RepID=A0AAV9AI14_ACOGR|nr:hypothetical protein QJS04_geneDACA011908 [Acorus gramineus]
MARREIENVPLSRFGVLVAQLESIAASAPQQPPDPILCFDLLSELVSAINEESQESILHWQRKCEDALFKLLVLGARCPVRHLASVAMARVIAKGDSISIYSRVSSLQGWLSDTKRGDALSYAGSAQCLGELYRLFGRRITSGLMETTSIAAKLMRFHEDFVRQEALLMLHNALEGSGGNGASAAYSEAFRIIMRVGLGDKSFIVRLASARCLKTFASIGGPGLGSNDLDSCASYCVKALEDPMPSVRDAFAEALGAILALGINPGMQMQSRGKGNPHVARKLEGGLQKHLVLPFMKASGSHLKNLRVGLSLSWVFLLQALRHKYLLPDGDLSNYALQVMDMLQGNSFVDAHATACVLYILRVGVADQMAEIAQRNLLVLLAKQLESDDFLPPKGVVVLRLLSYLLTTLGEVPVEFKEILDNTVVAALSHSSVHVRIEAALTLRGLAEVDPTCVGGLISFGVTTLLALRETLSVEKVSHIRVELDSFHGQAIVLAALISISPRLTLGYPARLPKSVLDLSKKIITEYSRNAMAATMQKEAGWVLLASLISSMPKEELEDQIFDILTLWAAPFGGNLEIQIKGSHNMPSEICVWSAAMEALTAFIRRFISSAISDANYGIFLQPVLVYLSGALSYICSLAEKQLHDLKPAIDLFTIRTLVAYQALPDPMAYRSDHSKIIQICTTPFRDPSRYEESSCLRMLLDKRDACLGPWVPGRDWFEDELRAFQGGSDGLLPCIWESQISSFPQPETISKALLNQMLMFFGIMFAAQDGSGKLTLLTMVDQCLKAGKKQSWHVASVTNVCVGLLSGLKASLALRQMLHVDVLSSMQTIFQGILAEGEICASQRRASAEGLGLLVRLGNDFLTARMIRSLLGELVTTMDSSYIGSIAFSLGCIHQSAGGIALSTFVPATVNSVSLLAKGSNTGLQSWSLHALRLTIEAAGLSYVSQVQATLSLAMEVLLSDENGWVELRQGVGRLVNAIIAVLGPELAPGSTFFSRCKSVVAEISSGQETSTLIECVRFTQQLVLFAPQAVSTHSHVQTLLPTLSSKQPSLRHLAVSTLHHLIEKDPVLATSAVHTAENHNSSGRTSLNGTSEGIAPMYFGEDVEDMIASPNGRQISTGQFEGMQPIGVGLLITIMDKFGKVGDPDLPGHLLLEQYQAQLVSAVRTALSSSSGPLLLEAGLQLATKILTSSILSGDRVALQRLFTWISHPLNEFKDLYYPSFAEWVACKYEPFLDGIQSLLVSSKVRPCLDEAWPVILQAIALDAAPMKSDTDVSSKVGFEDYSANDFISEPYLLPLESCEMALLVLQSLLTRNFFSLQFVTLDLCEELLQVLIYSEYMTASWNSFVVHLLLKIVQFCPDNFLDVENYTCSAIELCAKYLCKTFHSSDALLQTHPVCDDLLSALLTLTEKILFGVNHEMQDRLFLAIISTGCGCFRAALTDLCLLSVMSFFQNIAKKPLTVELVAIVDGCLRLLGLLHRISQKSECEKGFTSMLLETIFMIVTAPAEGLSKELNEIKGTAMALVSQLAQLPSAAAQVKDILLAMPVTFRLQLQDIIRVSVSQSQASVETKPNISIPATKLAVQLKPSSEPRTHASQSAPVHPNTDGFDEDDWDAFQSLPASAAVPPQASLAAANGSSVSDVEEDDFHDFSSALPTEFPEQAVEVQNVERDDKEEAISQGDDDRQGKNPHSQHYDKSSHHPDLDEKEAKGREFEGQDLHEVYDSLPFEDAKDELDDDHHVENKQCDFVEDSSIQPLGNANVTNDAIHEEAMRDGEGPNYHISSDSSPVMDPKEELSSGLDVENDRGPSVDEMNDALNEEATRDSEEHDFHKPSDSLPLEDPKEEYSSDHHVESNRGALLQVDELNDGGHDLHKSSGSMPAESPKEELNSECPPCGK